ncbi:SGNH/GDSL hydrolase family protein [Mucilaginibacter pedocola]|uniref:G-D-S-L family lipolytic protein n=1 Tax=Mucilaginibacter pedocola TaxID=1792845 RepID=A0A1S9PBK2_9SPHI|nr:SGNH/GDSL hydrolase family protein [Mucilaginibacter pedocola]OOQ58363.1 G-D-S-L family lipolytic protein [Mucilaginibacter pedocola]
MKYYTNIIACLFLLASCKPYSEGPQGGQGSADFSRYIAVGNSLTAGYSNGGLYLESQQSAYPAIIARQMAKVGGGAFTQPLFGAGQENGSGYLKLTGFTATGMPVIANVADKLAVRGKVAIPGLGNVTLYTKYSGDINNYGVPGIKLANIDDAAYGNLNGYFERLLPGDAGANTTKYIDFVTAKTFTFFNNWLGNNDALGYATAGGASDALTDKAQFGALYNLVINKLTATGQKGVVATIPDVTAAPYFTTLSTTAILAGAKAANPAVTALYVNARKAADITNTTYSPRTAGATDLILLTFDTQKIGQPVNTTAGMQPYGLSPYAPIENQYVLDANEVILVKEHINAYNATIKAVAEAKGLALFDAYTFLNSLKAGLTIDGVNVNSDFITGGIFSLDGIHLTPRGYAVVANEFIKAINSKYGSGIPKVNVAEYDGVK